jgi:hypothetical protein
MKIEEELSERKIIPYNPLFKMGLSEDTLFYREEAHSRMADIYHKEGDFKKARYHLLRSITLLKMEIDKGRMKINNLPERG